MYLSSFPLCGTEQAYPFHHFPHPRHRHHRRHLSPNSSTLTSVEGLISITDRRLFFFLQFLLVFLIPFILRFSPLNKLTTIFK